jgi:hypothetical protein
MRGQAVLAGITGMAGVIIYFVHYRQKADRDEMHKVAELIT